MGASLSSNVAKVAVNAVTKVAAEIVQNSAISTSSTQIISVSNSTGDVVISGNTMRQRATINMQALFNAMASEEAQQRLAVEIAQQAKAITSGINLGQVSAASNVVDTIITASISLASKIGQTCLTSSNQTQSIIVENTRGSTTITNNLMDQMSSLFQNCIESAVSNNKALQDLSASLSQTSLAESVGISEWAVVALAALFVGVPVVGGVVGGVYVLKYLFPVILAVGIAMLGCYFWYTKTNIKLTAFSTLITNSPACSAAVRGSVIENKTLDETVAECLADKDCEGFDFKGYEVNESGIATLNSSPLIRHYTRLQPECISSIRPDNVKLLRAPVLYYGHGEPDLAGCKAGDVYVDTLTSSWYQLDKANVWKVMFQLIMEEFNTVIVSGNKPPGHVAAATRPAYYIYADPTGMAYWHVFKQVGTSWVEQFKRPGPGLYAIIPPVINTTGIKVQERRQWLLYAGVAAAVIGLGGTVYTTLKAKQAK